MSIELQLINIVRGIYDECIYNIKPSPTLLPSQTLINPTSSTIPYYTTTSSLNASWIDVLEVFLLLFIVVCVLIVVIVRKRREKESSSSSHISQREERLVFLGETDDDFTKRQEMLERLGRGLVNKKD